MTLEWVLTQAMCQYFTSFLQSAIVYIIDPGLCHLVTGPLSRCYFKLRDKLPKSDAREGYMS